MSSDSRIFLISSAVAICTSLAVIASYEFFVFPTHLRVKEMEYKAYFTNKTDLLFSDKLNARFTSSIPNDFSIAAEKSVDAIVSIESLEEISPNTFSKQNGSGVVISSDGYIVTNYHVIQNQQEVDVLLNDKRKYKAKIKGIDPSSDLALLKVEAEDLPYLIFGNSDSLRVGEWVMAIGNPFKLQSSVTAGIISALGRDIKLLESSGIESFIQTDAAVNTGNSGGALINTKGELIGINTAILSTSGKYEGFSFAIPSNITKKITSDLREFGTVQRAWLGVELEDISAKKATQLGLEKPMGVLLSLVNKSGAAAEAGLISGDIILQLDQQPINSMVQLTAWLSIKRPGDQVSVRFIRDGKSKQATVILKNQLNTTDYVAIRKDRILTDLGIEIRDLTTAEKSKSKYQGIRIVSVLGKSKASQAKIEPGFVLSKINGVKVSNAKELVEYLESNPLPYTVEGSYDSYPGIFPYIIE